MPSNPNQKSRAAGRRCHQTKNRSPAQRDDKTGFFIWLSKQSLWCGAATQCNAKIKGNSTTCGSLPLMMSTPTRNSQQKQPFPVPQMHIWCHTINFCFYSWSFKTTALSRRPDYGGGQSSSHFQIEQSTADKLFLCFLQFVTKTLAWNVVFGHISCSGNYEKFCFIPYCIKWPNDPRWGSHPAQYVWLPCDTGYAWGSRICTESERYHSRTRWPWQGHN